jgi:hypothetical protein
MQYLSADIHQANINNKSSIFQYKYFLGKFSNCYAEKLENYGGLNLKI